MVGLFMNRKSKLKVFKVLAQTKVEQFVIAQLNTSGFGILPNELIVDNFAGGGGASVGIEDATGRPVDIAINHDPAAIDMHQVNHAHPLTKHYCEDVWEVDPITACKGRSVGLAWFSPDCKHFSRAKGGKPVDKNIRGLAWVAIRWALLVPVRILALENVEEFMSWGPLIENEKGELQPCKERKGETFDAFVKLLTTGLKPSHPAFKEMYKALKLNTVYDINLKMKLVKGLGYDLDYRVLHASDYGAATIRKRFFLVARNDKQAIQWPDKTHGLKSQGLVPFKTGADIIDWSVPVKSIFNRKKPLVENTLKRIVKGINKYVLQNDNPFFVPEQFALPFITECANASSQRNMPIDEPLRTICAQVKGGHFALVTCHVVKLRGTNIGHGMDEPLHTISAGGLHLGEVRAFFTKYNAQDKEIVNLKDGNLLDNITSKEELGIFKINGELYQLVDICLRMFEPHELFAAQGFPSDYIIARNSLGKKNSKMSQVARCGNSVSPVVAKALIQANLFPTPNTKAA